jgi:hypothetical protein
MNSSNRNCSVTSHAFTVRFRGIIFPLEARNWAQRQITGRNGPNLKGIIGNFLFPPPLILFPPDFPILPQVESLRGLRPEVFSR